MQESSTGRALRRPSRQAVPLDQIETTGSDTVLPIHEGFAGDPDRFPTDEEGLAGLLLRPHKTFRDPVHGDIMLTRLEVKIIDTRAFQRLRGIKQLGTAYEVFPGATHTRFEHSLGTVHCAQRIVDAVNKNPYPGSGEDRRPLRIPVQETFVIRLCALLHDLAHIPFGHSLEDEGGVIASQWNDAGRLDRFLGPKSDVATILDSDEPLKRLSLRPASDFLDFRPGELDPGTLRATIRRVLFAIESKTVEQLDQPYIADIVGNTLCADLLDYINRDMYYLGLHETFDERFVSYVHLAKYPRKQGKLRTVLRLIKPTSKELRRDVLSEFLQLLRLRYSLAEKALYHHTKIASSAMIMSAVGHQLAGLDSDGRSQFLRQLYEMTDGDLLSYLSRDGSDVARSIAEEYGRRSLVKPVYSFGRSEPGDPLFETKDQVVQKFCGMSLLEAPNPPKTLKVPAESTTDATPEIGDIRRVVARSELERGLEMVSSLKPGDVVVYCPPPGLGVKLMKTLVQVGTTTYGPAEQVLQSAILNEFKYSVSDKHRDLWRFTVFLNAEAISSFDSSLDIKQLRTNVAGDTAWALRVPNEMTHELPYQPYWQRYEDQYAAQSRVPRLSAAKVDELVGIPTRGPEIGWLPYSLEGSELDYVKKRAASLS